MSSQFFSFISSFLFSRNIEQDITPDTIIEGKKLKEKITIDGHRKLLLMDFTFTCNFTIASHHTSSIQLKECCLMSS